MNRELVRFDAIDESPRLRRNWEKRIGAECTRAAIDDKKSPKDIAEGHCQQATELIDELTK